MGKNNDSLRKRSTADCPQFLIKGPDRFECSYTDGLLEGAPVPRKFRDAVRACGTANKGWIKTSHSKRGIAVTGL